MSVAPFAGVVALDNFKSPTAGTDGIQGQVPQPLAGQQDYVLTASGWVPLSSLGTLLYQGTWDASTNNPTLVSSVGTQGYYYVVSVSGSTNLNGVTTWTVGDWAIFNGGVWQKIEGGSTVDITGGQINNTLIGNNTPAAGTFTTLIGGGGSANYGQLTGGATTKAMEFKSLGSDTNVAMALRSQGTGAIDLAAGSNGVNISNGGTVTAITRTAGGSGYTVAPTVTISAPTTAGGVQATATCTVTAGVVDTTFTITNAGSGYVEQPTITFTPVSGGSGASAFAVIGTQSIIKGIGSSTGTITNQSIMFQTPSGNSLLLRDPNGATPDAHVMVVATSNGYAQLMAEGSNANASLYVGAKGSGSVRFSTSSTSIVEQMRVSHTASAVNYVQVTGAATNAAPSISAQGSDANIYLDIKSKGSRQISFYTGASTPQFTISHTNSTVNYWQATGGATSVAPVLSVIGTDTNIDLALTPKGTGVVTFGTYTASALLAVAGYITIKDSGGTTRRLLVG